MTIAQKLKHRFFRRPIHSLIVWYIKRCGGAFHSGPYDTEAGRYVVAMNGYEFNKWRMADRPRHRVIHRLGAPVELSEDFDATKEYVVRSKDELCESCRDPKCVLVGRVVVEGMGRE